jgi:hypothetical protein
VSAGQQFAPRGRVRHPVDQADTDEPVDGLIAPRTPPPKFRGKLQL